MDLTHAADTRRIAKNTAILYMRMLFSMFVSLYTSRVIIQALGVEDYGIYSVVGGFVAMFTLISGALSASVSRFLTYELGTGNTERLKQVFSTSLTIHIGLAIIVLLCTETIGVWFLNNKMTIPADRIYAANWAFQASILSFLLSIFSVPFNASLVAHERLTAFAYIGILDTIFKLLIAIFIANSHWIFDRLIVYACLLAFASLSIQTIYITYCHKNIDECRLHLSFDKSQCKHIGAFAGWNFIGSSSAIIKDHGINILLNIFTGPIVNAARGIAYSVNTIVCSFVYNFMTALNPQITKSYANNDISYTFFLVEQGTRFSFYIILALALPILFETDFLLTLWLKTVPNHTVNFVRLILILSLFEVLSNTLITLQLATGKIRNYQLAIGGMQLMNFPLSYICLRIGLAPESTFIVAIGLSAICLLLRLAFLHQMVGLSITKFLHKVCLNAIFVGCLSAIIPYLLYSNLQSGWIRFIIIVIVCLTTTSLTSFFLGCNKSEKHFIREKILVLKSKYMNDTHF